jgi:hypothetical protein
MSTPSKSAIRQSATAFSDHQVAERFRFWDIATQWGLEKLVHDILVARALIRGVIVDGLRLQSVDPRWVKAERSLTGYPYVGYSATGESPVMLRAKALEHMLAVVRVDAEPSRTILSDEFVAQDDFEDWLQRTGQRRPVFWFNTSE